MITHFDPEKSSTGARRRALPSPQVQRLQKKLAKLGYYTGLTHGYVNPATVRAMDRLRRDAGLPATGRLEQVA